MYCDECKQRYHLCAFRGQWTGDSRCGQTRTWVVIGSSEEMIKDSLYSFRLANLRLAVGSSHIDSVQGLAVSHAARDVIGIGRGYTNLPHDPIQGAGCSCLVFGGGKLCDGSCASLAFAHISPPDISDPGVLVWIGNQDTVHALVHLEHDGRACFGGVGSGVIDVERETEEFLDFAKINASASTNGVGDRAAVGGGNAAIVLISRYDDIAQQQVPFDALGIFTHIGEHVDCFQVVPFLQQGCIGGVATAWN